MPPFRMSVLATVAWVLAFGLSTTAQEPFLVKDIRPGLASGFPLSLAGVNGRLFFSATTDAEGGGAVGQRRDCGRHKFGPIGNNGTGVLPWVRLPGRIEPSTGVR